MFSERHGVALERPRSTRRVRRISITAPGMVSVDTGEFSVSSSSVPLVRSESEESAIRALVAKTAPVPARPNTAPGSVS